MKTSMLWAAITAALFNAPVSTAQTTLSTPDDNTPRNDASLLERVTVIGVAPAIVPANTGELQGDALDARRAAVSDTAQLLGGFAGVALQGAGGVSALPAIHGLVGDRNRVQIDGMDFIASCPNHMNPPLSYIDPAKVGTIRVYAGVVPVSAGGDSIGGAIQVLSKAPAFAADGAGWGMTGDVAGQYRSNGNARGTSASATLANADVSLAYDGSVLRADNYRAGGEFRNYTATGRQDHELPRDEVASTAYLVRNQTFSAAVRNGTNVVQASFGLQEIPLQLYPNQRMDMLGNTHRRWQLAHQGSYEWGTLETRGWHEQLRHGMGFGPDRQFWYGTQAMVPDANYTAPCAPIGPMCAAGMPMKTQSRTSAMSTTANIAMRESDTLRIGGEWQHYGLNDWWPPSGGMMMWPGTFWNINDGRRDRASLFAEWEGELAPQWMALLGARSTQVVTDAGDVRGYDIDPAPPGSWMMTQADAAAFNTRDRHRQDHHLDITALLRWTPSKSLDLEIGYSRKSRSPNLYERYAWSSWTMAAVMNNFAGDGNGYVGDIGLKPERARTIAATLDWHAPGSGNDWRLRITPWVTRIDDYVDAVALTTNGPTAFNVLRYANQSARLHGIDLSGEARIGSGAFGDIGVKAVAAWVHGENRTTDNPLYNTMPENVKLSLTQHVAGWDNAVEWELVGAKNRVSAVRNELPTPGFGLLHLRGGYAWRQWRFDFGVENALNKSYALPTGGIYVAQGMTMGINAVPHGIAVPGSGRSYYAAFKSSF
ncbi:MAG: TonB-dependent receptor [Dokdonella sp.]